MTTIFLSKTEYHSHNKESRTFLRGWRVRYEEGDVLSVSYRYSGADPMISDLAAVIRQLVSIN